MIDNRIYYRNHAQEFFDRSAYQDVEDLYAPFLPLLPPGARILDAGCGSGRDTKAFAERGYMVTAFDATPEMVELAERFSGQKIRLLRFQEMDYENEFEGIWACASLLHVPLTEMPAVFARFIKALKPNGYWNMSFKYGMGEKQRGERLFTDFTEESLRAFLEGFDQLKVMRIVAAGDTRFPDNGPKQWVSAIVQKVADG
jgi:SAM-dependent methyltransferase